ncbi:MAG: cysteine hydrolase [Firmicutes bacterium]|nr:cysteine hydrolase [Bacillota bacterium]
MRKALIIIDFTNDFVADNGKLSAGLPAQNIDITISKIIKKFDSESNLIVVASDSHEESEKYSIEAKLFPSHCIKGSNGQKLYGETAKAIEAVKAENKIIIEKQKYSAFFGTSLDLFLRQQKIEEIFLCGVCSDICVLHTAVSAYNLNYKINVYKNAIATFNPHGEEFALQHFKNCLGAGILEF